MKKKVLITGVSGFAGSHLAEHLVKQGRYEIFGTYLSDASLDNLEAVKNTIALTKIDLVDTDKTFRLVKKISPGLVFHLAAMPAVDDSYKIPTATITNNVTAQINVLEGLRNQRVRDCRILVVSSADVYGKVLPKDLPIDEETLMMPTNTYAVSKIAQDFLGLQYYNTYGLNIIRARPFNHIGPRQATGFVVADFAKTIALIEKGKIKPVMEVGNLDSKRDFTDVRDMVRAYSLLLEKGTCGDVYNIGSGVSYKIKDILAMLLSLSKAKIAVGINSVFLRREDAPDRLCDNRKFVALTGWKPTIPIEKTLAETLDYWRHIV